MTHKMMTAAAAVLLAGAFGLRADDKKDAPLDDATFVKKAASGGMLEVELGKVAAKMAKNDDIKKFGERMVKDHTKANEELKTAAKAAGVEVPAKLTDEHAKHFDMFANYKGTDFDRDYAKHMLKDHEEDVALFTRASKELKSKELKDFATKTLPVLQQHLEEAKKLNK